MPFLDAKALETDPNGMAFLRSVISGDGGRDKPARTRLPGKKPPIEPLRPAHADLAGRPIGESAAPAALAGAR